MSMRPRLPLYPAKLTQRGAAAIEFALLTLPLAALCFGITEFGRALHQYNTVAKNVRDAARYQSTVAPGNTAPATTLPGICLAMTGSTANSGGTCSGSALLPGLTVSMIAVCDRVLCPGTHNQQPPTAGTLGKVNLVTVTVTGYPFTSMVPFAMPSIAFGPISATMAQPL
jgi:Flp pilus assembly protein TadG